MSNRGLLAVPLCALFVSTVLAGCASSSVEDPVAPDAGRDLLPTPSGFTPLPSDLAPLFGSPILIDEVRAGGEPVVAVLPSGTILVSAHPGWTHVHDASNPAGAPGVVTPANAQSYLWRSTDNGTTWSHVNLIDLAPNLPRSAALGVSDPEFTVMEDGTVCMTDLEGLAMSSVSCSSDDGATWLVGNPAAAGAPNDRQWLASLGDELYFTANYFTDHHLRASTDRGLTWEDRGDVPCAQDLVANRRTGHLVVACDAGIAVSEDQGRTWSQVRAADDGEAGGQRIMAEPAIDAAGNVWVTYTHGESAVLVAGTPDEGLTWPWVIDLTPHARLAGASMVQCPSLEPLVCEDPDSEVGFDHEETNGTYVWPWVSAGSAGRVAVSWIHSFADAPSGSQSGPWFILSATLINATDAAPTVVVSQLTTEPIHTNPICQSGTTCQVGSVQGEESEDRRLGDFFETTIDASGNLLGSWSNTQRRPGDSVSHPEFVRQVGGISLLAPEDVGVFMPTQG